MDETPATPSPRRTRVLLLTLGAIFALGAGVAVASSDDQKTPGDSAGLVQGRHGDKPILTGGTNDPIVAPQGRTWS